MDHVKVNVTTIAYISICLHVIKCIPENEKKNPEHWKTAETKSLIYGEKEEKPTSREHILAGHIYSDK